MKDYLAYLEKLQNEMIVESEVDYQKVSEWRELQETWDNRGSYTVVSGCACLVASVTGMNTPHMIVFWFAIVLGLLLGLVGIAMYSIASDYGELARDEFDKIYDRNCETIKEYIFNDGDEQFRQLKFWHRVYDLSEDDKLKYRELLRIVDTICVCYSDI